MDREVAKLWLYQNTITTTVTPIGYKNADGSSVTWFVNMRDVLGETLWTKYEAYQVLISSNDRVNIAARIYCNGLNLIQTSSNGDMEGYSALINGGIRPYGIQTSSGVGDWDCYAGASMYTMLKPIEGLISLTLYLEPFSGAIGPFVYGSFFMTFQGLEKYNPLYKNPFNTFHSLEQRTFTLTTQSLVAGSTNQYGTLASNYTSFTLTNINFRQILGSMWNKYDKFNLIMTSWGCGVTTSGSTISGDNRHMFLIVEGLQFINNVSVGVGSTTFNGRYGIGGLGYSESAGLTSNSSLGNFFDNMSTCNTFRKPETENVSLTITIGSTTSYPMPSIPLNNWAINFMVIGVKQ